MRIARRLCITVVASCLTLLFPLFAEAGSRVVLNGPCEAERAGEGARDAGDGAGTDEACEPERSRVVLGDPLGLLGPLRADFAPPDALLLVFEPAWTDALQVITAWLRPWVEVAILATQDQLLDASVASWVRENADRVVEVELDTPWVRDFGPLQRVSPAGRVTWIDTAYAAARLHDDELPVELGERWGVPVVRTLWSVEGGGLISNGDGLCGMTESNLAETGVRADDPHALRQMLGGLGCEVLAVLPALPGERTGHADMLAQFTARDRAVVVALDAEEHPDDAPLLDLASRTLEKAARAMGVALKVTRVPASYGEGELYSYVNGLRAGGLFLVPEYASQPRSLALAARAALRSAMPGVQLVPVPADAMLDAGGAVHCVTLGVQTPPAAGQRGG